MFRFRIRLASLALLSGLAVGAPATEADLKPGATVFVPAQKGDDGALATGFVAVGVNGVDPPM